MNMTEILEDFWLPFVTNSIGFSVSRSLRNEDIVCSGAPAIG